MLKLIRISTVVVGILRKLAKEAELPEPTFDSQSIEEIYRECRKLYLSISPVMAAADGAIKRLESQGYQHAPHAPLGKLFTYQDENNPDIQKAITLVIKAHGLWLPRGVSRPEKSSDAG